MSYFKARGFNEELIINYGKKVYNKDISKILKTEYCTELIDGFKLRNNLYDDFSDLNPIKKPDDKSRKYFNACGSKRYIKWIEYLNIHNTNKDYNLKYPYTERCLILPYLNFTQIHHIYPLNYDGDNSIFNLIHVCDFVHNTLHLNPLEHIEKYCRQAVSYLYYICNFKLFEINKKYNIAKISNSNKELSTKMTFDAINNEMYIFYKQLETQYNKECVNY